MRYSASESNDLKEAMTVNLSGCKLLCDRLSKGSQHLSDQLGTGQLQGAAMTMGKQLFEDVISPAITKLNAACQDLDKDLKAYEVADRLVSSYGILDEEDLATMRKNLEAARQSALDAYNDKSNFFSFVGGVIKKGWDGYHDDLKETKKLATDATDQLNDVAAKEKALKGFIETTNGLFTDSRQVFLEAAKGADALSQIRVDGYGHPDVSGVDMSWTNRMQSVTLASKTQEKVHDEVTATEYEIHQENNQRLASNQVTFSSHGIFGTKVTIEDTYKDHMGRKMTVTSSAATSSFITVNNTMNPKTGEVSFSGVGIHAGAVDAEIDEWAVTLGVEAYGVGLKGTMDMKDMGISSESSISVTDKEGHTTKGSIGYGISAKGGHKTTGTAKSTKQDGITTTGSFKVEETYTWSRMMANLDANVLQPVVDEASYFWESIPWESVEVTTVGVVVLVAVAAVFLSPVGI